MKKGEWQKKWKWEGGRMAKEVEWGGGSVSSFAILVFCEGNGAFRKIALVTLLGLFAMSLAMIFSLPLHQRTLARGGEEGVEHGRYAFVFGTKRKKVKKGRKKVEM
jgi:predicted exporter